MDKDDDGRAPDNEHHNGDGDGDGDDDDDDDDDDDGDDGDGDGNEGQIGTAMNESINRGGWRPRASLCRHAV